MGKKRNAKMHGTYQTDTFVRDGVTYRICAFCGKEKPITDFHRNGTDAMGMPEWRQDCKVCYNVRRKENRTKKKHSDFIGNQKRRGEEDPDYSHQEWKETVLFFGGECAYCGCTPKKGSRLTRDHLVPVSEGGRTIQENIVPACATCNSSKGASEFKHWYMKQPFFSQERLNQIFKWRTIMRQIGGGKRYD